MAYRLCCCITESDTRYATLTSGVGPWAGADVRTHSASPLTKLAGLGTGNGVVAPSRCWQWSHAVALAKLDHAVDAADRGTFAEECSPERIEARGDKGAGQTDPATPVCDFYQHTSLTY